MIIHYYHYIICCFEENFYCALEAGVCNCDLYMCSEGPDQKEYWMEITGYEAWKYCGKPQLLYEATGVCLCDPTKTSPCLNCSTSSLRWEGLIESLNPCADPSGPHPLPAPGNN